MKGVVGMGSYELTKILTVSPSDEIREKGGYRGLATSWGQSICKDPRLTSFLCVSWGRYFQSEGRDDVSVGRQWTRLRILGLLLQWKENSPL